MSSGSLYSPLLLPSQGEYGEKGISSFTQLATKSGICIGVSITINRNAANKEFIKVKNINRLDLRIFFN